MAVDPQLQAFLDQGRELPGLHELPLADARALLTSMNALAGSPEPVSRVEDRAIPGPDGEIALRVYTPAITKDVVPIILYLHGGGFTMGGLESHDSLCRALANASGCMLIAVDYRLAPEHPFPAGIDDADAALRWVTAHASELGGDAARLAVGGDSGGATFAATLCIMSRDRGWPAIAFQFLINPGGMDYDYSRPSCHENAEGYFLTRAGLDWVEEQYFSDASARASDWRAAPGLASDLSQLPPAIVLTAELDPVRDQGRAFVERLRAGGVSVRHREYPGVIHGWVNLFGVVAAGREGLDDIATAVRENLQR